MVYACSVTSSVRITFVGLRAAGSHGHRNPAGPPRRHGGHRLERATSSGVSTMRDDRRGVALAIKSCLDSLQDDAVNSELEDLARFIGLAALAAEEAATAHDHRNARLDALMAGSLGHC